MKLILNQQHTEHQSEILGLMGPDISFLSSSYPGFQAWLLKTVIPGVVLGERTIIVDVREGKIGSLLILKHTKDEQKLCTLRVHPELQSKGLGVRLFQESFEILQTDKPILSVNDQNLENFSRIFNYFGFKEHAVYRDIYRPRSNEIAFNGLLLGERYPPLP